MFTHAHRTRTRRRRLCWFGNPTGDYVRQVCHQEVRSTGFHVAPDHRIALRARPVLAATRQRPSAHHTRHYTDRVPSWIQSRTFDLPAEKSTNARGDISRRGTDSLFKEMPRAPEVKPLRPYSVL